MTRGGAPGDTPGDTPGSTPGSTPGGTPSGLPDAGVAYLLVRLAQVEAAVGAAIERRSGGPVPAPDLLFSADAGSIPETAGGHDEEIERAVDEAERNGVRVALRDLQRCFGLADDDVALLLVALAPEVDRRFERFYGFLHDDPARVLASTGLALELCGLPVWSATARDRLGPRGALVRGGLLTVGNPERAFLSRSLRVPDRVVDELLGNTACDPAIAPLLLDVTQIPDPGELATPVARVLAAGATTGYLRGGSAVAVAVAVAAGRAHLGDVLVLDLDRAGETQRPPGWATLALREARLRGACLVVGPVDARDPASAAELRELADAPWPVLMHGGGDWEPALSTTVPFRYDVSRTPHDATGWWAAVLAADEPDPEAVAGATAAFTLGPSQVQRAVVSARLQASAEAEPVGLGHLRRAALLQNSGGLERLARRITPTVDLDDLVLGQATAQQLDDLVLRCRYGATVLDDWQLGPKVARRRGVTSLFAGPPGTGKTYAAEAVAGRLGLDLYLINLATLVDKYIGETEKNLERLFASAEQVNGVLFFDEADALFGKRSEVRDARDRYANIEVAYLLQRIERFDGIAVLTTNLRSNVDEAFLRRLDAVVEFPEPTTELRLALWERLLDGVPMSPDTDLDRLAREFDLAGGHIRNTVLTAAFLAAADGGIVGNGHLLAAVEREYRKMGRLWRAGGSAEPLPWAKS